MNGEWMCLFSECKGHAKNDTRLSLIKQTNNFLPNNNNNNNNKKQSVSSEAVRDWRLNIVSWLMLPFQKSFNLTGGQTF